MIGKSNVLKHKSSHAQEITQVSSMCLIIHIMLCVLESTNCLRTSISFRYITSKMKDSPDTSISVKSSIPTISFHNLHSSSSNDRIDLAKEIHSALSSTSLFYASKTSISSAITTRLHDITKEFFTLPYKEKMKIDGQKEVSMGRGWRCYKQGRECDPSVTGTLDSHHISACWKDKWKA